MTIMTNKNGTHQQANLLRRKHQINNQRQPLKNQINNQCQPLNNNNQRLVQPFTLKLLKPEPRKISNSALRTRQGVFPLNGQTLGGGKCITRKYWPADQEQLVKDIFRREIATGVRPNMERCLPFLDQLPHAQGNYRKIVEKVHNLILKGENKTN